MPLWRLFACIFCCLFYLASDAAEWQSQDFNTTYPGSTSENADGSLDIEAGGSDIWGTADSYRFVFKQFSGNFDIRCRVKALTLTDPWAKVGVMVRQSMSVGSSHAFMCATGSNGFAFQRRTIDNEESAHIGAGALEYPNAWVRLVRNGSNFIALTSTDGAVWHAVGEITQVWVDPVYVGVAVTAHTGGTTTNAQVESLQLSAYSPPPIGDGSGLSASYWSNVDFSGTKFSRVDSVIDFNWADSGPDQTIGADSFSVRWRGQIKPQYSETYTFYTGTDDGVRLWVNNQLIVDKWFDQGTTRWSGSIALTAGQKYDIRMEYYENGGDAAASLEWSSRSTPLQIIPQTQLYSTGDSYIAGNGDGLNAKYFNNTSLQRQPAVELVDSNIHFNWGDSNPKDGVNNDNFSVRWTGQIEAQFSENYTFSFVSDDGVRIWFNNSLVVNNWVIQEPTINTFSANLVAGQRYNLVIEYYESTGGALAKFLWSGNNTPQQIVPQSQLYSHGNTMRFGTGDGLSGQYFDNIDLSVPKLTRVDPQIDFDWGFGSPAVEIGVDSFSIRWQGQIEAQFTETYTFSALSSDGMRLWVNGQILVDQWNNQSLTESNGTINLTAGQKYSIRVEYFEFSESAVVQLMWSSPNTPKQMVPQAQLYSNGSTIEFGSGDGLRAYYFNSKDLDDNLALQRIDPTVNFEWSSQSPGQAVDLDDFSVRWLGQVKAQFDEVYTFYVTADDGVRLWVNNQLIVDQWNLQGATEFSGQIPLSLGQMYNIKVEYFEHTGDAVAKLAWSSSSTPKQIIPQSQLFSSGNELLVGQGQGLAGYYFNSRNLSGKFAPDFNSPDLIRIDPYTVFDWADGRPDSSIYADNFSVRWVGEIQAQYTETYTFYVKADDGVRLWLNQKLIIDHWPADIATEYTASVPMKAGEKVAIKWEYTEHFGLAYAALKWASPSTGKRAIPKSQLYAEAGVTAKAPSSSFISPLCVEGTHWAQSLGATSNVQVKASGNDIATVLTSDTDWYCNVPLKPSGPTNFYALQTANGSAVSCATTWQSIDLKYPGVNNAISIRRFDSLLLTSSQAGTTFFIDSDSDGEANFSGKPEDLIPCKFNKPGTFIVRGFVDNTLVGSILVTVIDVDFRSAIASEVSFERTKNISIIPASQAEKVQFQAGDPAVLSVLGEGTYINGIEGGAQLKITPIRRGTPRLIARLDSGSIIAVKEVDEFVLESAASSHAFRDPYTGIVNTTIRIIPHIPNIEVNMTMFAHRATFYGGLVSKIVNTSDAGFLRHTEPQTNDIYGEYALTLEVPAEENFYCFFIKALQADTQKFIVSNTDAVNGSLITSIVDRPIATAPVGRSDKFTTSQDQHLLIAAPGVLENDVSVAASPIAVLVESATNGTLTLNSNGSFEYSPRPGFYGYDGFAYKVIDGLESPVVPVQIFVENIDDPLANANPRYWIASTDGNWSDPMFWSTVSGGPGGASVPDSNSMVYFDANGVGQCTLDTQISVKGMRINNGYTSRVIQGPGTNIVVGLGDFVQRDGEFICKDGSVVYEGDFKVLSGMYQATRGTTAVHRSFLLGEAAFNSNYGVVEFCGTGTIDLFGVADFHDVRIDGPSWSTIYISEGDSVIVNGSITFSNGRLSGSQILTRGNVNVSSSWDGGDSVLKFIGQEIQIFNGPGDYTGPAVVEMGAEGIIVTQSSVGLFGGLTLKSGTFRAPADILRLKGELIERDGIFDDQGGTVEFTGSINLSTKSLSFHNVAINAQNNENISIQSITGRSLEVKGTLRLRNGLLTGVSGVEVLGDIEGFPGFDGVDVPIVLAGSSNQSISASGGTITFYNTCSIDKPHGIVFLSDTIELYRNLSVLSGDVEPNDSTLIVKGISNVNLNGVFSLNNLIIDQQAFNGNPLGASHLSDGIEIRGRLTLSSGILSLPNDGTVYLAGDVYIAPANNRFDAQKSTLIVNGTSHQMMSLCGQSLFNLNVLGTAKLTLDSGLKIEGNLTLKAGCEVKFSAGNIFEIGRIASETGPSPCILRSTLTGQPWNVVLKNHPAVVTNVDIRDCNATIGNPLQITDSIDSGSNHGIVVHGVEIVRFLDSGDSITNPAWVEGWSRPDVKSISVVAETSSINATRLSHTSWFATNRDVSSLGVQLNAENPTLLSIEAATPGRNQVLNREITWLPTDLKGKQFSSDRVIIRQADALLFTCSDTTGNSLTIDANGDGVIDFAGLPGQKFPYTYSEAGDYTAFAHIDGALVGELRITAVAAELPSTIAAEVKYQTIRTIPIAPYTDSDKIFFCSNDSALLAISDLGVSQESSNAKNIALSPQQRGLPVLAARLLSSGGPIISYREIEEFTFESSAQTHVRVSADSNLGATQLTMRPFVPNLSMQLTMQGHQSTFYGGATSLNINTSTPLNGRPLFRTYFDDYTGEIIGIAFIQLEVPAGETKYCFSVSAFDSIGTSANLPALINGDVTRTQESEIAMFAGMARSVPDSITQFETAPTVGDALDSPPPVDSITIQGRALARNIIASRAVGPQKYRLTVKKGTGSGQYEAGTVVTVIAVPDTVNRVFGEWDAIQGVADPESMQTTFTMPAENISLEAHFDKKYRLILKGGKIVDFNGSDYFLPGETVRIIPADPPPGKGIQSWDLPGPENVEDYMLTVVTRNKNTTVRAKYGNGFSLTVSGGTPSGIYGAGLKIPIRPYPLATGQSFAQWVRGARDEPVTTAQEFTFTMPTRKVELKAKILDNLYQLTVVNGTGGGRYRFGEIVQVAWVAATPARAFVSWSGPVASQTPTTTVSMPATDVEVVANESLIPIQVTVVNGTGSGIYLPGTVVPLTAISPENGLVFAGWTGIRSDGQPVTFTNAEQSSASVVMPEYPIQVTASFRPPVLVVDEGLGGGNFAGGTRVPITANVPPLGKVFDKWVGAPVDDERKPYTLLTMPTGDTTVHATYINAPPNTVTLIIPISTTSGNYLVGSNVTIVAPPPADAFLYEFDKWNGPGVQDPNAAATTIVVQGNSYVYPTYRKTSFLLTVENGSGGGRHQWDSIVEITADPAPTGFIFYQWEGGEVSAKYEEKCSLKMPKQSTQLRATYRRAYRLVILEGKLGAIAANRMQPKFFIPIAGTENEALVVPGFTMSVQSNTPPGDKIFDRWTDADVTPNTSPNAGILMPERDVTTTALFRYPQLTVAGGIGSGAHPAHSTVTISANCINGRSFNLWTGASVASPNEMVTTMVMPKADTTVTATYYSGNPAVYVDAQNFYACPGNSRPNDGHAVIDGPSTIDVIDSDDPAATGSFNVLARIVTINTPRPRDLFGKFKLSLKDGNASTARIFYKTNSMGTFAPYTLGTPFQIIETGHEGCGHHCWHSQNVQFKVQGLEPGSIQLIGEIDPDPEYGVSSRRPGVDPGPQQPLYRYEGDGAPAIKAQMTINVRGISSMTLTELNDPSNTVTSPTESDLYLPLPVSGGASFGISATITEPNPTLSKYLWAVEGAGASPSHGSFAGPTQTQINQSAQTYIVKTGFDVNSDGELQANEVIRQMQVNPIRIRLLGANGTDVRLASDFSCPTPKIVLNDVNMSHVVLSDPKTATVTLSGEVTYSLADILPNGVADITQVNVEIINAGASDGQVTVPLPVTKIAEPSTATRPFAFRGVFSTVIQVPLSKGDNTVTVIAKDENTGYSGSDSINIRASGSNITFQTNSEGEFEPVDAGVTIDMLSVVNNNHTEPGTYQPLTLVIEDHTMTNTSAASISISGKSVSGSIDGGRFTADRPIVAIANQSYASAWNMFNATLGQTESIQYRRCRRDLDWAYTTHSPAKYYYYAAGTTSIHICRSPLFSKWTPTSVKVVESYLGFQFDDDSIDSPVVSFTPIAAPATGGDPGISVQIKFTKDAMVNAKKKLRVTLSNGVRTSTEDIGGFGVTKLKVVIVGVDGLNHESIRAVLVDPNPNTAPTFKKLFAGSVNQNSPALAALPTVTWCNWPGIFSGQPPRDHGCIGNAFFEREKNGSVAPFASACDIVGSTAFIPEDQKDSIGIGRNGSNLNLALEYRPGLNGRSANVGSGSRLNSGSLYDNLSAVSGELNCHSVLHFYNRSVSPNSKVSEKYFPAERDLGNHNRVTANKLDSLAAKEGRSHARFRDNRVDVLSLYFPGPDNIAHSIGEGAAPAGYSSGPALPEVALPLASIKEHVVQSTETQLKVIIDEIDAPSSSYIHATVFALCADHGLHAYKNLDKFNIQAEDSARIPAPIPPAVATPGLEFQTLINHLSRVLWRGSAGVTLQAGLAGGDDVATCDFIFSPSGGIAQVYVRQQTAGGPAAWNLPPNAVDVESLASLMYKEAVGYAARIDPRTNVLSTPYPPPAGFAPGTQVYPEFAPTGPGNYGALGDAPAIFVRIPSVFAPNGFINDFQWLEFVDPTTGTCVYNTIANFLAARQASGKYPNFSWPEFVARIDEMNDKNGSGSRTGDIIFIPDGRAGYLAVNEGDSLPGWHGGPEISESHVALMFNIPDGDNGPVVDKTFIFNALPARGPAGGMLRNWQLSQILTGIMQAVRKP